MRGITLNLVEGRTGISCYVWRTSTDKGRTARRQVSVLYIPDGQLADGPPDLLRELARQLELKVLDRPHPPA